ncbi:MAG: LLM class flavin-dependent oxidoreductase [Pseudomonadota bacterium]|nr:LLM class flavin-dependent oxidoreductase [Pseudomonadota bacterium]
MKIGFGLALDFWSKKKTLSKHLDQYSRLINMAEEYGFNSIWAGEFYSNTSIPGHTPSPLMILAALAGRTNLRIGTGVTLITLWHPLRLAYDGAILDHLSEGRFTLGVGVGAKSQLRRFGYSGNQAGSRMDEALELLKAFWSGADSYQGKHFQFDGNVFPSPIQKGGPPILIGGAIKRSIDRSLKFGEGWYGATQYHFEVIKRQAALYNKELKLMGVEKEPNITVNRTTFLAPTNRIAQKEGMPYVEDVLNFYARMRALKDIDGNILLPKTNLFEKTGKEIYFLGTPSSCIDEMTCYIDAGVTQFNFRVGMGDMPIELIERTVKLLGEKVIPHFT